MINKRIASAIATGSLLLSSFATPAFATTTINLSGNGSDSDNTATVDLTRTNTVVQNNTAKVSNYVDVDANTGDNDANDNTGGDVNIDTGNSSVEVAVQNLLNKNSASIDCCANGGTSVKIANNGSDSDNDVDLDLDSSNSIFQDNEAKVDNDVYADANTGNNDAEDNTNGDVSIDTGRAEVGVGILNALNANFASIGGGDEEGGNGLSLWVLGNGHNSDNSIDAYVDNSNTITQDNDAHVYNDVDVDAKTGHNDANDNTGGEVSVDTGNANVDALVANFGNFNWADLSCDCLFDDVTAKIADNGSDTDNNIDLDLDDSNSLFQDNYGKADNDLYLDAKTGNNEAEDNTLGSNGADPAIDTGNSDVNAEVVSQFNANEAGIGGGLEFDFDWEEIFGSLGL